MQANHGCINVKVRLVVLQVPERALGVCTPKSLAASVPHDSKRSSHGTWSSSPRRVWISPGVKVSWTSISYDPGYGGDRLVQWNCNLSGPSSNLCGRE